MSALSSWVWLRSLTFGQPLRAGAVECVYFRSLQPRHVLFDCVANLGLQVSKMTISFRISVQSFPI